MTVNQTKLKNESTCYPQDNNRGDKKSPFNGHLTTPLIKLDNTLLLLIILYYER